MGMESNKPATPLEKVLKNDGQIIDMVKSTDGSFEAAQKNEQPTNLVEKKFSDEIVTKNMEMEVGILVSSFFDIGIRQYAKSKGVEVNFFIDKELPLSKVYRVEFKGKDKDIQTVTNYIRSKNLS